VAVLLAALAAAPATAADRATLAATAGLGGYGRPGRWAPVRVDVTYEGDGGAGEIAVEWGDARVRQAISLASETRKEIELYVRTADPRDSIVVRLLSGGRELAATEAPVRLLAQADAFTVCIASPAPSPAGGAACSVTIAPVALPRSWRGYAAADDVLADPERTLSLTADQRMAVTRWRTVHAIENADASSPALPTLASSPRVVRRTGYGLLVYVVVLAFAAGPLTRIRARSFLLYPAVVGVAACASAAAVAAGRVGPGAAIHVAQAATIEEVVGGAGAFVVARGVAEFPVHGPIELRAIGLDGVLTPRTRDRGQLRFDENGAPAMGGVYTLGASASFEMEGITSVEPLHAAWDQSTLRVTNTSTVPLRSCRFGSGFSRSAVGILDPGQSVDADRRTATDDAAFSCSMEAPAIVLGDQQRAAESTGTSVVVLHAPERRSVP
jgi:hypothetical protein